MASADWFARAFASQQLFAREQRVPREERVMRPDGPSEQAPLAIRRHRERAVELREAFVGPRGERAGGIRRDEVRVLVKDGHHHLVCR